CRGRSNRTHRARRNSREGRGARQPQGRGNKQGKQRTPGHVRAGQHQLQSIDGPELGTTAVAESYTRVRLTFCSSKGPMWVFTMSCFPSGDSEYSSTMAGPSCGLILMTYCFASQPDVWSATPVSEETTLRP